MALGPGPPSLLLVVVLALAGVAAWAVAAGAWRALRSAAGLRRWARRRRAARRAPRRRFT